MVFCECGNLMENLGNIDGIMYTSCPPQWDEVHVCHICRTKRIIRERGRYTFLDNSKIMDYRTIENNEL